MARDVFFKNILLQNIIGPLSVLSTRMESLFSARGRCSPPPVEFAHICQAIACMAVC